MSAPTRKPTTCGGCDTRWRQVGNRTGHCSQCHRTFSGITTFDAHQSTHGGRVHCADPAGLVTRLGDVRFRAVVDQFGAQVWRSAVDLPDGTFKTAPPTLPDCAECHHPADNHDRGECWTAHGRKIRDDDRDQCDCWGYQTRPGGAG